MRWRRPGAACPRPRRRARRPAARRHDRPAPAPRRRTSGRDRSPARRAAAAKSRAASSWRPRRNSISPSRSNGRHPRGAEATHSRAARSARARSPAQRHRFCRSSSIVLRAASWRTPNSEANGATAGSLPSSILAMSASSATEPEQSAAHPPFSGTNSAGMPASASAGRPATIRSRRRAQSAHQRSLPVTPGLGRKTGRNDRSTTSTFGATSSPGGSSATESGASRPAPSEISP